jgi:putative acetyltransferase
MPAAAPAAIVRAERPDDAAGVRRVNELAFGSRLEADLVERLRLSCPDVLSFVADERGALIGHIMFTPVVVESGSRRASGMGLAPMAVVPDRQRQGIGSALVAKGLEVLRDRRCPFIVVVGHPEYYPRFGFEPASRFGLSCQWGEVSDAAFMAMVLDPAAMAGVSGIARYRSEFSSDT